MKKSKFLFSATLALVVLGLSGCMGNPYQLTPEQQAQAIKNQQEAMAKMQQVFGNKITTKNEEKIVQIEIPAITQNELKNKISAFGTSLSLVNFEKTKSGFSINGKPYSDYEGSIKYVNYDSVSGFITYLVETSRNQYSMKFMQATSKLEPLVVANVNFKDGAWHILTITGKKLTGDTLILGSSGFVISREDGSGFVYEYSNGIKSIDIPKGYRVARFQNGDILGTKTILLEIPEATNDDGNGGLSSGFAKSWSNLKTLGAVLGVGKKEDYAFFNIESGKLNKINISSEGKTTTECILFDQKDYTKHIKKCLQYAEPVDSIYDIKDSSRNTTHYFWLITWINAKSGAIGLTHEKGRSDIYATNLSTGKKVLLASRALGYETFDFKIQNDGRINLIASNGVFGSEIVEDIESKLETLPAVEQGKEEK